MIYLDNAATVFPKPQEMLRKMVDIYGRLGVSPGRGGYDSAVEMERHIHQVRINLARLMGTSDPDRLIFTANATDALNTAINLF